jgi:hypothetical protein
MIYFQICYIALGIFLIICSAVNYFIQPKSSFFILKRVIEYLDENERIKYQKAIAIPEAMIGIVFIILGIFFIGNDIYSIIYLGSWIVYLICNMIINKIHLGYFSPWSVPKKIF